MEKPDFVIELCLVLLVSYERNISLLMTGIRFLCYQKKGGVVRHCPCSKR